LADDDPGEGAVVVKRAAYDLFAAWYSRAQAGQMVVTKSTPCAEATQGG
jgi:hypothetical protein